jgi:hypothetical protein
MVGGMESQFCRVYWGTHGCNLERGHPGDCECDCCDCVDHASNPLDEGVLCVAKPPYYGPDTRFYGDDVRARRLSHLDDSVADELDRGP